MRAKVAFVREETARIRPEREPSAPSDYLLDEPETAAAVPSDR